MAPISTTGHSTRPATSERSAASGTTSSPCAKAWVVASCQIACSRSEASSITKARASFARQSSKPETAKRAGAMKRWPSVLLPAVNPSSVIGTTSAPPSSERRQRIDWSGRTQRREPVPQRIDLGQGKVRITRSSTSATISGAGRPGFSTTAKRTAPFLSARVSS